MQTLPLLRCDGRVALPGSVLTLRVEDPKEIDIIENMMRSTSFSRDVVILTKLPRDKKKSDRLTPDRKIAVPKAALQTLGDLDCYAVGCTARVSRVARMTSITLGGTVSYEVTAICKQRVRVSTVTSSDPFYVGKYTPLRTVGGVADGGGSDDLTTVNDTLRRISSDWLYQFAQRHPNDPRTRGIKEILNNRHLLSDEALGWIMLSFCNLRIGDMQAILECDNLLERQQTILSVVQTEMESFAVEDDVAAKMKEDLQATRRRLLLEQQLKVIQSELNHLKRGKKGKGDDDDDDEASDDDSDTSKLEAKLKACNMPPESAKLVRSEVRRLKKMNPSQLEYGMLRSYLETVADLPWNNASEDCNDMKVAEDQLNADHCGLEKVKRRILEFLAVRQMKVKSGGHSPILCLAGPPGVGKTSLGKSIAAALGRKFCRVALGGVSDEAEIRGHRRTYVASFPGRIMTGLKRAGTNNPVMLLDEIDKLGVGIRGDPAAALLEVLDPEQNCTFTDTYLGIPFDLSNVLFIATANSLSTISAPLLDRMEVLQLEGYTMEEKLGIAEQHLVPRQIARHGLLPAQFTVTKEALQAIIREYTREAGVRNLEKHVAQLCRHVVTKVVSTPTEKPQLFTIDEPDLKAILGTPSHRSEVRLSDPMPCGVATGLAWTPTGGEVLFVEASTMPGSGKVQLTGQLGEVMQESVHCAVTWIRANAAALFLSPKPLDDLDLHVHVPSGAVQKDGPSAGVAMVASIYSILSHTPLPHNIAMTGEITLTGRVTAVGGIRDKILAAYRYGMRTVILPTANMSDVEDLPQAVKEALTITFVDDVAGAIAVLFKPEDIQSRMRNFDAAPNFRGSKL